MTEAEAAGPVTIVTQTRVRDGKAEEFAAWQDRIGRAVADFPGFAAQSVVPPTPPAQVDWVVMQTFETREAAVAWLQSDVRRTLLDAAQPLLVGRDDVHIVRDAHAGVLPSPVSVVISTRVRPGREDAYRAWERRIATAQAAAPGVQGYRLEPPIPGVQEDWLAILRFDTEAHLDAWMNSPERQALLAEASGFMDDVHARVVRTGFDQWFPSAGAGPRPPAWKQNMLVLLMLYPVVFLFGHLVQAPLLVRLLGLPFWLALFIGNAVSVVLLNWLVPWVSGRFGWWLRPAAPTLLTLAGTVLVVALYGLALLVFAQFG